MPQRRDNAGAVCNSGDRLQCRPNYYSLFIICLFELGHPNDLRPTATPTARAKKSVDEHIFNSSQSTSLTFIICLFELGHPNDLRPTATPTARANWNIIAMLYLNVPIKYSFISCKVRSPQTAK